MKKLIFASLIIFQIKAHANLTGNWNGWGSWEFQGSGVDCNMGMEWKESKTHVEISRGMFDCGIVVMHLGQTGWDIKDGLLFDEDNVEVGTYDGKELNLMMPSPNENTTIHVKVTRLRPTAYEYQETWFNKYEKVYVIKGKFFNSQGKE